MSFRATYRTSNKLILITDFINDDKLPEAAGGTTQLPFYWKKTGQKRHCFESVSIFQLIHHLKSGSSPKQCWPFTFYESALRLALFTKVGFPTFNLKHRIDWKKKHQNGVVLTFWNFGCEVIFGRKLAQLYQNRTSRSVCKPFQN